MALPFSKMHGCGNDFVVLDGIGQVLPDLGAKRELPRFLCDRRFGIGCDQLLVLDRPSRPDADFRMGVYNADGSQVEMCGNGIRCIARFVAQKGYSEKSVLAIETLAGIIRTERLPDSWVRVDMGAPVLEGRKIPADCDGAIQNYALPIDRAAGRAAGPEGAIAITAVSMGNPHCVTYVDSLKSLDFARLGPYLSAHPFFPRGANVEFVEVVDRGHVRVKVWERGAGPTLACGTGACAVGVASVLNGKTERKLRVSLPGGDLDIFWDPEGGHVFMTGPAEFVFEGSIEL